MMKDTTKAAAVAVDILLFDDWTDAIEDGVRARVRGFIEAMLEEELEASLSRPRYGRRKADRDGAPTPVAGCRHGHRERTLTGTFGKTKIAVPRARLSGEDGKANERDACFEDASGSVGRSPSRPPPTIWRACLS